LCARHVNPDLDCRAPGAARAGRRAPQAFAADRLTEPVRKRDASTPTPSTWP
jgi:hypothetical protein